MIKITIEINEIKNRKPMEKMNQTDNQFSGENNKIILIKKKRENKQITNIIMKRGLSLYSTDIQRILRNIKNNQRQKFNYIHEIKQLLENHEIQFIQDKTDNLYYHKFIKIIQLVIMPSIKKNLKYQMVSLINFTKYLQKSQHQFHKCVPGN